MAEGERRAKLNTRISHTPIVLMKKWEGDNPQTAYWELVSHDRVIATYDSEFLTPKSEVLREILDQIERAMDK